MNLNIKDKNFVVSGASSGFGHAIALRLVAEGARVIAVARTQEKLEKLETEGKGSVEILCGDITQSTLIDQLMLKIGSREIAGVLVNAGGPPAKSFLETSMGDWDAAYTQLLRWKVDLSKRMIPLFEKEGYGRFLFIESASLKQPMDNLVLSTSLRLSVAGFVKTMASELAAKGITANILAPGYHNTAALDRIFRKISENRGITAEQARQNMIANIPVQKLGDPDELASLAVWLLSPLSSYVTGQTITLDGGTVKYLFG